MDRLSSRFSKHSSVSLASAMDGMVVAFRVVLVVVMRAVTVIGLIGFWLEFAARVEYALA